LILRGSNDPLRGIDTSTVRSRYKRRLIQLNLNKSGLHELEWKTRDPYSLVSDSLITRTHCSESRECGTLIDEREMAF